MSRLINELRDLVRDIILMESIATPILYHFTNSDSLKNILVNNNLLLTSNISSKSDQKGNASYYMSFTRTKSTKSGYGTKFRRPNSVRITFDGTKLNNNYKFLPIDYWQYPKTPELMLQQSGDETEDRLVSDKDSIPNANKYIKRVDMFVNDKGVYKEVIDNANRLGIEIFFYDNEKDFENGNPLKSITPNIKSSEDEYVSEFRYSYNLIGILSYKNPGIIPILKDKISDLNMGIIEEYHNKLDTSLHYSSLLDDTATAISTTLSNSKTTTNPIERFVIFEINKDYKKLGATSIKDYLVKKMYIGKKTQKDFNNEFYINVNKFIDDEVNKSFVDYRISGYVNGEDERNLFDVKEFVNDYKKFINDIKGYLKDYILNNNDMYEFSYVLSNEYIEKAVDSNNKLKYFKTNYGADDNINGLVNYLISDIDRFCYDEKKRLQAENIEQWYN